MREDQKTECLHSKDNTNQIQPEIIHEDKLSGKDILKLIFARIVAALILLVILISFIILSGAIAGHLYNASHDIPDPVVRGDDLGGGLVVMFWASVAAIFSLASSFHLFKIIHLIIKKLWIIK